MTLGRAIGWLLAVGLLLPFCLTHPPAAIVIGALVVRTAVRRHRRPLPAPSTPRLPAHVLLDPDSGTQAVREGEQRAIREGPWPD